ncbi:MAG: hypothetical protein ACKO3W_08790 [bacterium]
MFEAFDVLLSLPTPVMTLLVLMFWGLVSFSVHRFVVPRLCGADGRALGRFEAEVTSQIALAFGLLISFNAVWVWERSERVQAAIHNEATALGRIIDDAEDIAAEATPLAIEKGAAIRLAVRAYADDIAEREWPMLTDGSVDAARPDTLKALRATIRARGNEAMRDALDIVEDARDVRVHDGTAHMQRSRWGVVFLLAVLLLISIGALHGEAPRGRKLALTLVTLAISFCFVVLFVNARPFVGPQAMKPDALRKIAERAGNPAEDTVAGH